MKVKVVTSQTEGFTSSVALRFENGLILKTVDLLFMARFQKEEVLDKFRQVIVEFEKAGTIVENQEKIKL